MKSETDGWNYVNSATRKVGTIAMKPFKRGLNGEDLVENITKVLLF